MNISLKFRTGIITAALAIAALAYAFFVFLPTQRKINQRREELTTQQNYVMAARNAKDGVQRKRVELDRALAFIELWEKAAPDQGRMALLFANITDHARQANTITSKFDPQPISRMDQIERIPIAMGNQGNFRQLFDLVKRLESLSETIWVDELQIEALSQDSQLLKCELNLAIFAVNREISD